MFSGAEKKIFRPERRVLIILLNAGYALEPRHVDTRRWPVRRRAFTPAFTPAFTLAIRLLSDEGEFNSIGAASVRRIDCLVEIVHLASAGVFDIVYLSVGLGTLALQSLPANSVEPLSQSANRNRTQRFQLDSL